MLAYISDGHGRTKERPALVISRDEENDRGDDLQLIAITTKIENPRPFYHVVVHDRLIPMSEVGPLLHASQSAIGSVT